MVVRLLSKLAALQGRKAKQCMFYEMHKKISLHRIEELERMLSRKNSDLRALAKRSEDLTSKLREMVTCAPATLQDASLKEATHVQSQRRRRAVRASENAANQERTERADH